MLTSAGGVLRDIAGMLRSFSYAVLTAISAATETRPDDVKRLAIPLFAHRVVINTRNTLVQRRADVGERIIEEILSQVEVPL